MKGTLYQSKTGDWFVNYIITKLVANGSNNIRGDYRKEKRYLTIPLDMDEVKECYKNPYHLIHGHPVEFREMESIENGVKLRYAKLRKKNDITTHLTHCYQGEYEDSCKYGDSDCPAFNENTNDMDDNVVLMKWLAGKDYLTDEWDVLYREFKKDVKLG